MNPKLADETLNVDFEFGLAIGETITGALVTCTVYTGADESPETMIVGGSSIADDVVSQSITGGVSGVIYEVLCSATTSTGQLLEEADFLAVE